ncbi:response regulator [Pseudomonas putida]|uniref:response regulator n=1 Tax=Pseudomonas putida TaxID=303 RepID=UPI003345C663
MKKLDHASKSYSPRVLVVEDEPMIRELLTLYLEDWGVSVTAVATADEGREKLDNEDWALLISDAA